MYFRTSFIQPMFRCIFVSEQSDLMLYQRMIEHIYITHFLPLISVLCVACDNFFISHFIKKICAHIMASPLKFSIQPHLCKLYTFFFTQYSSAKCDHVCVIVFPRHLYHKHICTKRTSYTFNFTLLSFFIQFIQYEPYQICHQQNNYNVCFKLL